MIDMDLLKSGIVVVTADRYEEMVMNKNELMHTTRKLWNVQDRLCEAETKLTLYEDFFSENSYEKREFEEFVAKRRKEQERNESGQKSL